MKNIISYLPEEINTQILLQLPFESILTCKLVSKQWRDLIPAPKFFKLYNARNSLSLFLYKDDLYCLIIRLHHKISGTIEGPHHPPFTVHRVPVDLRRGIWSECPTNPLLLSGPSSVIACVLRERGDFVLYNLFNGTSVTVAADPSFDWGCGHIAWGCFGFGYNPDAGDYNIMVAYRIAESDEVKNLRVSVYSFRNHAWKQLKGFPYTAYKWYKSYTRRGFDINGVLHWLVAPKKAPDRLVIVTYDLRTSRFGTILLPHDSRLATPIVSRYNLSVVAELDGQLCCCCFLADLEFEFELWVMKEYGVRDSWAKLTRVTEDNTSFMNFRPTSVAGIYKHRNGRRQMLFICNHNDKALLWYDIDDDNMKVIGKHIWSSREGNVLNRDQDIDFGIST